MFKAFVLGAGLSGLTGLLLEPRHCEELGRVQTKLLRRMAGGKMSWEREDGQVRCFSNKQVLRWWGMNRIATELRIRRLRWYLSWALHGEDFSAVQAAIFGDTKLDEKLGVTRLKDGWICDGSTPWAKQVVQDFVFLAQACEEVADWYYNRASDISMFQKGSRDWWAWLGTDPGVLRKASTQWNYAEPEFSDETPPPTFSCDWEVPCDPQMQERGNLGLHTGELQDPRADVGWSSPQRGPWRRADAKHMAANYLCRVWW